MQLTALMVPTYQHMLKAQSSWLDKAAGALDDPDAVLSARLAPDMLPLTTQIRFSCLQAQEACFRLQGEALPERLNALGLEGRNGADQPGTIAGAKARLQEACAFLGELSETVFDAAAEQPVSITVPGGMIFDMTGEQYVRDWALPQFYFHVMASYTILRAQGVAVGKADYIAHAFPYLRPGTAPGSS